MATTPKKKKARVRTIYTSYHFTEHDPILDWYATAKKDSGKSDSEITAISRVTRQTLRRYELRKTKYPRFETLAAAAVAVGADFLPITAKARREYKLK